MMLTFLKIMLFIVLGGVCVLTGLYIAAPDGSEYLTKNPTTTALMERRNDEYKNNSKKFETHWQWVPLRAVSPNLLRAVILAEDARFYQHAGYDLEALRYAWEKNLKRKKYAVGGSTITQQLAKNLYLSPKKSILRKVREFIIAIKMEHQLPKRRILELYVNVIELGRGVYGVEAGSRRYFGKSAAHLTLTEASRLASIIPSPRRHSPYDGSRFTERRHAHLLRWLYKTGNIDSLSFQNLLLTDSGDIYALLDSVVVDSLRDELLDNSEHDEETVESDSDFYLPDDQSKASFPAVTDTLK